MEHGPDTVETAERATPRERPQALDARTWPLGRAAFLGAAALGTGLIALANRVDVSGAAKAVGDVVPGAGALAQLAPSPSGGWRIYSVAPPFPRFDPATYALRIDGLVEQPVTLTWDDVLALPGRAQVSDFHCVTGWSVTGVRWEGVAPQTIVDLVRPRPEARVVEFGSLEEPYVDQLELDQFLLPDTLLARAMDGGPVPREHGAPLRLVVPRMYGYKSVKWLGRITFTDALEPGYWEVRGYDADAWLS